MSQMMLFIILLIMISSIIMILNLIFSKKSLINREKNSPFECGFDPISENHLPFSIQFFMISLIFLIFDIEITLLIPLIIMMKYFNLVMISCTMVFMFILIFSLYMEYSEQSMDWKI